MSNGKQTALVTEPEDWARSDKYHNSYLNPEDPVLEQTLSKSAASGLPDIAVSAAQGKYLKLVALSIGAKRILEIGTLGGYSTIWLARALPENGLLITAELLEEHAKLARENIEAAGLGSKINIVVGHATKTLANLQPDPPFDLIFIDADKPSNVTYYKEAKRLVRRGGVIIVDNVVRWGRVADPTYTDQNVEGVRSLLDVLKDDREVDAVTMSTVGEKGYDGFMYIVRL